MTAADRFDLERFVTAQAPVFETVLAELRAGRKLTHWMWFIFRQFGRSRTILDGPVLWHQLHRGSACVSGPLPAGAETPSLHRDRAYEREFIPSCDFRLARRYEVPVMHDAVLARYGRPGQSVSPCARSLVRRPARRTNPGADRCGLIAPRRARPLCLPPVLWAVARPSSLEGAQPCQ